MEKPTVEFTLTKWQAGHHTLTAKTNWPDLVTSDSLLKIIHVFKIVREGRFWTVDCPQLAWTRGRCRTLASAAEMARNYMASINGVQLDEKEIWRNSGGFLCIGGYYKGYYLYATKQPGKDAWEVRADKEGQIGFKRIGSPASWLIDLTKGDIDRLVNPVTKMSLKRELAELPF